MPKRGWVLVSFVASVPLIFCRPGFADEPLATLSKYVPTDGRMIDGFGWYGRDMDLYESEFPNTLPYSALRFYSFSGYELRGFAPLDSYLAEYPDKVIHLDLHFDDREELITNGSQDVLLAEWGNKFLSMNRPLYMDLGHEVNGAWNNYQQEYFVDAFRYMVDFWDNMGVTNVCYIWNVHIMDAPFDYMEWYPGDNYVHWWSHEILGPQSDPNWNHDSPAVIQSKAFALDAVSRGLPVMIGEASAWLTGVGEGQQSWDDWFDGFFNYINSPAYGIRGYVHMPHDWSTVPGYTTYEDARPSVDAVVKANWQAEIYGSQYLHEETPINHAIIGWPLETTPPGNVTNVQVNTGPGEVTIGWDNPADPDLKGIKILRQTGAYPSGPRDTNAVQVHNGQVSQASFTDTDVSDGTPYYYAVFAYDPVRNYASGIFVTATPGGPCGLRVKDSLGATIAYLDSAGDLALAGSLIESSTPRGTTGSELLIKSPGGAVVAAIYENGNLVLEGTAHQQESTLTPPPGSFVVKNAADQVVGYIDSAGDLYLAGSVSEGSP